MDADVAPSTEVKCRFGLEPFDGVGSHLHTVDCSDHAAAGVGQVVTDDRLTRINTAALRTACARATQLLLASCVALEPRAHTHAGEASKQLSSEVLTAGDPHAGTIFCYPTARPWFTGATTSAPRTLSFSFFDRRRRQVGLGSRTRSWLQLPCRHRMTDETEDPPGCASRGVATTWLSNTIDFPAARRGCSGEYRKQGRSAAADAAGSDSVIRVDGDGLLEQDQAALSAL